MSRMPLPRSPAVFMLVLAAGVCGSNSSNSTQGPAVTVTDTLGKTFALSCPSSSLCTLTPQNDLTLKPRSCDVDSYGTDDFVLIPDPRILTVSAIMVPTSGEVVLTPDEPSHPIACATAADCAPSAMTGIGLSAYSCLDNICQYPPSVSYSTVDLITLCQWDIPWPTSCEYVTDPAFAARMAELSQVCGETTDCSTVPADCVPHPSMPGSGMDGSVGSTGVDAGTDELAVAGAGDGGSAVDGGI
jgi:hypothetical protein